MTNNDRREAFKNAFQNLQMMPLVTSESLDRFRVDYGEEILEELTQLVEDCSPNDNKVIFTGHRGSGKSTLLGQFCRQMQNDYFVVFFSIADWIEMSDVNHVTVLFAMAVKLMEEAETQGVKISRRTKEAFHLWFSKHTKTESFATDTGIEIETVSGSGCRCFVR